MNARYGIIADGERLLNTCALMVATARGTYYSVDMTDRYHEATTEVPPDVAASIDEIFRMAPQSDLLSALESAAQHGRNIHSAISRLPHTSQRNKIVNELNTLTHPWVESLNDVFTAMVKDTAVVDPLQAAQDYMLWCANERRKAYLPIESQCGFMPVVTEQQIKTETTEYGIESIYNVDKRWMLATIAGAHISQEASHLSDSHSIGPLSTTDKVRRVAKVAAGIGIAVGGAVLSMKMSDRRPQ